MQKCGFQDTPIKETADECLGLGEYASALSDFIVQCDTPMTIAIQGDWGSGKTSMIHMIIKQLPEKVVPVYINTWQFAQFDRQSDIAISVLTEFVDKLGGAGTESGDMAKKLLSTFSRHAGKVAAMADMIGVPGAGAIEGIGKAVQNAMGEVSDTQRIKALREKIRTLVEKKQAEQSIDRFVAFIDDLDRLLPEKAVEVLEAIKLFLDLPGCVFVLALDYQVVVKGVAQKYGGSMDLQKGKDFFDKMIQLPFNMPVGQYNVQQYMKNLLEGIGSKVSGEEIQYYQDLTEASIGFNPRGMKRMFNTLLLLRLVAQHKKQEVDDAVWQRILFALLCLQASFEPIYRYLTTRRNLVEKDIEQFFDGSTDALTVQGTLHEVFDELKAMGPLAVARAARFMKVFFNSLQLDSEGDRNSLSRKELDMLQSVLSLAALTTTETKKEMDFERRRQNRALIRSINQRMSEQCRDILPLFGKDGFMVYQSNTEEYANSYILFDNGEGCSLGLNLHWDGDEAEMYVGRDKGNPQKIAAWANKIEGLQQIEKYYAGQNGMPAWGRFAFTNSDMKEREDKMIGLYSTALSLIAKKLQAVKHI